MNLAVLALDFAPLPLKWRKAGTDRWAAFYLSLYFLALDVGPNCIPLFPIALWAGVQDCD